MGDNGTAKAAEGDRLATGYAFFRRAAAEWLDENLAIRSVCAQALAATLRQRLWLFVLNLGADDQAQVIFETLNARGTPLLPADLIKNLLLRRAEGESADVTALYEAHWKPFDAEERYWRQEVGRGHAGRPRVDLFLVQYLTAQVRDVVSPGQLYERFAEHVARTGLSAAGHMAEVARWARTWRELDGAKEDSPDPFLVCAARVRALDYTTALPVLLHLRARQGGDLADAAKAALWIESFLVRRMVCALSTRNYGKQFVDLLREVIEAGDGPLADVVASHLLRSHTDGASWPDDSRFEQDWVSGPLYHTLRRDRLTLLLRALEAALRGPKHDAVPIPKTGHVEHVMPQNWRKHWPLPPGAGPDAEAARERALHTIGNLTLLTANLNVILSDAAWVTKRTELQRYGLLVLNTQLAGQKTWDEATIQARGTTLLGRALTIWPRPTSAGSDCGLAP